MPAYKPFSSFKPSKSLADIGGVSETITFDEVKVISTDVANNKMIVDGGNWGGGDNYSQKWSDAPMSAGAVVEVGGDAEITETTSDLSENVFGVISEQPAYAMNAGAGNNDSHPFVAMTGRTPVRVTGEVTKGQRLVTSSVKGWARAVATGESISPFNVIGRALECSDDAGIKLVNCAVRTIN